MSRQSSYSSLFVPVSTSTQQDALFTPSDITFQHFLSDNESNLDSVISQEPDDEKRYLLESVSRGRPFPTWYFNKFEPKYVTKIPDDINGTCFYKIKVKQHMWHAVSSDKHHFRMLTSSHEGFFGERHIGTCKGTFEYNNKQCPFIKTSHCHQPNRVSWRNVRGMHHVKICLICDHVAQHLNCDHEEDVLAEAEQGNNPAMYIPKSQAKHRVPKKHFTTKKPTAAPPRKVKKAQEAEDLSEILEEKLAMAMAVCDSKFTSTRKNKIDNPPMLIYATWQITKCRGCKKPITDEDKAFPHSFVLHRCGVVGYFNKLHNKWLDSEQNIHFHMNMDCVCKHDSMVEKRHVSCNDEVFCSLTAEEMTFLHTNGFLKPVAEKKME